MRKLKYILIFGIVLFIPNIVKADTCSVSSTARLKNLASNITTKYDYNETLLLNNYGSVDFTITISNVTNELYVMKVDDYYYKIGHTYQPDSNNQIVINNLEDGISYHFIVYGNTNDGCKNTLLYEFFVNTPKYNKFYTDKLCSDIPNYKYCKKWANINLTSEQFENKVKAYKESLKKDPIDDEDGNNLEKYESFIKMIEFLDKYDIFIFGSIIILSIIGIVVLNKKDSFDLEIK